MRKFSAYALNAILFGAVLVMWSPYRWATSAPQAAIFVLAAMWAIRLARRHGQPKFSTVLIPLCGTVLWPLGQLVFNHTVYRWQTWNSALYWGANLAFFFSGLQTFDDARVRRRFLDALLAFGFILSIVSPLQMFTANGRVFWLFQTDYQNYVLGPFVYHNQYAAFIEMLLPLALWNGFSGREKSGYYLVAAAVMYSSVIASASRTGFALATLELALVPALLARRRIVTAKRMAGNGAIFAGTVVVLVLAAGTANLWSRFQTPDPYAGRRQFAKSSLDMIRARPLAGFGMGTWPTAYPGFAFFDDGRFANQAHNDWAQWTVEGGIPFAAIMLWIAIWGALRGFRTVWGIGGFMVFLHCFVDYPIQRAASAGMLFVLLSAAAYGGSSEHGDSERLADGH